ncbi:MAG: TonB-dependent receptor, partial [Xanthomonadales bacterium]|nr:TonB-dependent receptor [Xanthomonadales bacterium]
DRLIAVEPIVSDNRELGLEWTPGSLRARIAVFDSTADNGSLLRLNSQGIFEVERQRTEIDGVEVSLEYLWDSGWLLGGNFSHSNGRFDSNNDGRVDSDLDGLNIGPNRFNLYLQGEIAPEWSLRAQGALLSDRDFDGLTSSGNANFDGYSLVDLILAWDSPVGRLSLGVENLFNRQYVTYFSQVETGQRNDTFFAGSGRSLSLGWQHSF